MVQYIFIAVDGYSIVHEQRQTASAREVFVNESTNNGFPSNYSGVLVFIQETLESSVLRALENRRPGLDGGKDEWPRRNATPRT